MSEELLKDNMGYTFKRVVNKWSLDKPLIEWHVNTGFGEFIKITDSATILNLEQDYHNP